MIKSIACLCIAVSIVSCKTTTTAPESTGTMTGQMHLMDLFCNHIPSDGITVELLGTSFKATSDAQGIWKITGLPAGYYDIQFSKGGFASTKLFNIGFSGAGTLNVNDHYFESQDYGHRGAYLSTKTTSTVAVSNVRIALYPADLILYSGYTGDSVVVIKADASFTDTTSFETDYGTIALYASKSPNIDPLDPTTFFYQLASNTSAPSCQVNFSEKMNGLRTGDTVYAAAGYIPSCGMMMTYYDPSGAKIFPAIGPLSSPIAIVIP